MVSRNTYNQNKKGLVLRNSNGFTLIEILVVIAIVIMIFGFSSFIDFSSYNHTLINTEESTLVSVLSKARSQAMNNVDANPHGVYIDIDNYVLYNGTSFASGTNKETIPKNSKTGVSGITDIYFDQLSGEPHPTGIITLTDTAGSTRTITIKTGGLIDW